VAAGGGGVRRRTDPQDNDVERAFLIERRNEVQTQL
jgi:hypothetical protein